MAPARKKQRLLNGSAVAAVTQEHSGKAYQDQVSTPDGASQYRSSLFVRSLPASTTTETLTDLFSESYPIKHAIAVTDPATKQCRGYGFVTFADAEDAQKARAEFNGQPLEGRKLRVEIAEPRHREAAKDGGQNGAVKLLKRSQDTPQPSRLIVRNLPWTIKTSAQLEKLFLSYGKVKQAYIPKTRRGLMAGFGFVVLRGRKNAEKALEGVNGKEVDGRTLAVDWAVSKEVYEDLLKKGQEQSLADGEDTPGVDGEVEVQGDAATGEEDVENMSADEQDAPLLSEDGSLEGEDEDIDVIMNGEDAVEHDQKEDRSSTLFIRNLPFTCADEDLEDHFAAFGKTRYARVVLDPSTERSKGTGFVCFYNKTDADSCLRAAPRQEMPSETDTRDKSAKQVTNSVLQNEDADPSGQYTMDGRVLQISRAVDKSEANRLTEEGVAHRRKKNEDKRRLYLLSEGSVSSKSKLWEKLSPTERNMREASTKQRKTLVESNPSLHLSLTRLSVRNIPRTITSKDLKSLAREAVVGFATDVKAGTRQKLSKEELARGGEDMEAAEKARKKSGKGLVKQAKVVFEGAGGSKVEEGSGAGRSRGYGFVEYHTHRSALMGLRWLNGHKIEYQVKDESKQKGQQASKDSIEDRKKRLIVEFAIENAQVVMRRNERALKTKATLPNEEAGGTEISDSRKRKRGADSSSNGQPRSTAKRAGEKTKGPVGKQDSPQKKPVDERIAQRNRIIGRKRAQRQARKGAK